MLFCQIFLVRIYPKPIDHQQKNGIEMPAAIPYGMTPSRRRTHLMRIEMRDMYKDEIPSSCFCALSMLYKLNNG